MLVTFAMRFPIALTLLFSLACSKSEPAAPPAGATPSEASAAPSEAPATPGQAATTADEAAKAEPSIALLAAGAEPRRVLLRTFKDGAKETINVRSQVTMIAHMGPQGEEKTVVPPIFHTLALEVRSVQPDGTATVGFEVLGSEVQPYREPTTASVRDKMEAAAASIRGLKGTYQVDAQGIITAVEVAEPAKDANRDRHMADSIGEFIYRSTVPVPSEAVGRGGKWTVTRRMTEGGILVDQTSTYQLRNIDASHMEVGVTIEKSAPKQKVGAQDPYDLQVYKAKGSGQFDVELNRLAPRAATSKLATELFMNKPGPSGSAIQTQLTAHVRERMSSP